MKNKGTFILGTTLFVFVTGLILIGFVQYVIYQVVEPFTKFSVTETMGQILDSVVPIIKDVVGKK